MKKITIFFVLAVFILQVPLVAYGQVVPQVSTSSLMDIREDNSIVASFTFDLSNSATTSPLVIPKDGFKVSINGKNVSQSIPAEVISFSGGVKKIGDTYQVQPKSKNATFKVDAVFDRASLYSGTYTASFDGIYFLIASSTNKSASSTETYIENPPTSTEPLQVFDAKSVPKTPLDYSMDDIEFFESVDPVTGDATTAVEMKISIEANSTDLVFYKSGMNMITGTGKKASVDIVTVTPNMIDQGTYYTIPASSIGTIRIKSTFTAADLPRGPYSLKVFFPNSDITATTTVAVKKPSFFSRILSEVRKITSSIFGR